MTRAQTSDKVLLDGARMVVSAFLAGTIGFLKERNIPVNDWVSYIGEKFEDSWDGLRGEGADRVMQHLLALQVLPLGADVGVGELTPEKAEVSLTPLPSAAVLEKFGTDPKEFLSGFGITQKDFASIYRMFEPSAEAIGFHFSHRLKDGRQVLSLEKVRGDGKKSRSPAK